MTRSYSTRYLGNKNPASMEVHDLSNEMKNCQIDEIIANHHDVPFSSHEEARQKGFDNCAYCIGNSTR